MTADTIVDAPRYRRDSLAGWTPVRIGTERWLLRPDVAETLPSLIAGAAARTGTLVKRGPHRTVRRLESPAGEFYLKQFHRPDWRTRLRHLLRFSQARWEWSRFQQAAARGIPTPDVVAIGHDAAWHGESSLVTRGLIDAVSLDRWIAEFGNSLDVPLRRRLTRELGRLIGEMHRHRVVHLDLHAGNILVRLDGDEFSLWIVDLSPLRFRPWPLTTRERSQNLGRLRHSLLRQRSAVDEAAFFHAYWRHYRGMMGDAHQVPRPAVRDIARQCDAVARACWDQMDRKWARGNRKTVILDTPNIHCRGLADLGRDVLESLCAAPEQLEALKPVPPLRFAGRTITILTRRHAAHRHAAPDQSWARRSWEIGHALERRLIAAPVPVFMLEHRRPAGVTEYLALANEPGWQSLADLLAESPRPRCPADDPPHRVFPRSGLAANPFGPASAETQCRASLSSSDFDDLGRRVVDLLRRFHELGFAHDALTLAAFDVRKLQGRWQVRFATLDAIRQIGRQKPQPLGDDLRSLVADVPHRTIIGRSLWLRWLLRLLPDAQRPAWKAAWKQLTVPPLSRAA